MKVLLIKPTHYLMLPPMLVVCHIKIEPTNILQLLEISWFQQELININYDLNV